MFLITLLTISLSFCKLIPLFPHWPPSLYFQCCHLLGEIKPATFCSILQQASCRIFEVRPLLPCPRVILPIICLAGEYVEIFLRVYGHVNQGQGLHCTGELRRIFLPNLEPGSSHSVRPALVSHIQANSRKKKEKKFWAQFVTWKTIIEQLRHSSIYCVLDITEFASSHSSNMLLDYNKGRKLIALLYYNSHNFWSLPCWLEPQSNNIWRAAYLLSKFWHADKFCELIVQLIFLLLMGMCHGEFS